MNRLVKVATSASIVALVGLWSLGHPGLVAAQLSQPRAGAPFVPRYTYRPGYQGYGYYMYTNPGTYSAPSGIHNYATSPGMFGPGGMTVGPGHRDWTTGRSSPIAKPWLRPMD